MPRKKNFYYQNRYFISAVRYQMLLENAENMGKSMQELFQQNNLDGNIKWRFKKFENSKRGELEFDLSKVNIANSPREEEWVDVDSKVIEITKEMIKEGLSDEEISSKIYSRLMEGGVKMSNVKVVKNISVDGGNNNYKVCIDDNEFLFVNKVRKERQVTKIADSDYITLNDDLGYYIIANDNDKFEESESKKDKKFIPTLYYSICRALRLSGVEADEVDVNLSMLTPINQGDESSDYIEKIKEKNSCMCTYRIDGNEDTVIINIKNIEMYLEGVASLPLAESHEGLQAIIDIGSKTINIVKSRNSKINYVDTIDDLGSFDYYEKLINKINNRNVNLSNIHQLLEDGIYEHDKDLLKEYLRKVLEETNKMVKFSTCVNVNFTGGTIELFKDNGLNFTKGNIRVMNNPTFTNVKGSKVFLDAKYKEIAGE